jgi:serine O-acetyltransferase
MIAAKFLQKWFAHYFTSYSPEWIDEAFAGFGSGQELFFSDLGRIHADIATSRTLGREVFDIIETDTTIESVFLYRLAHSVFLRDPQHASLRRFAYLMKAKTGTEIYYSTEIGPRFRVEHGIGLVIGPRNHIGSDFTIHQGVTLGQRRLFSPHEKMQIGNHCVVFAGAKILGAVKIGDHVKIAANAVLLTDAESHSTYAGVPAMKIPTHIPE